MVKKQVDILHIVVEILEIFKLTDEKARFKR